MSNNFSKSDFQINNLSLEGTLQFDSKSNNDPSKTPFANFIVENKQGKFTHRVKVLVFGDDAIAAGELKKGDYVFVSGKIGTNSFTRNGDRVFETVIIADKVFSNNSGANNSSNGYGNQSYGSYGSQEPQVETSSNDDFDGVALDISDDDIPF